MFIIFCEIILCLLEFEEYEIEEKRMCFEKYYSEFIKKKKKMLVIIFRRNEIKIIFLAQF